jgi:hypothetical protein
MQFSHSLLLPPLLSVSAVLLLWATVWLDPNHKQSQAFRGTLYHTISHSTFFCAWSDCSNPFLWVRSLLPGPDFVDIENVASSPPYGGYVFALPCIRSSLSGQQVSLPASSAHGQTVGSHPWIHSCCASYVAAGDALVSAQQMFLGQGGNVYIVRLPPCSSVARSNAISLLATLLLQVDKTENNPGRVGSPSHPAW